nr:hypothetical protein [Tanacetum cinerariifolium]
MWEHITGSGKTALEVGMDQTFNSQQSSPKLDAASAIKFLELNALKSQQGLHGNRIQMHPLGANNSQTHPRGDYQNKTHPCHDGCGGEDGVAVGMVLVRDDGSGGGGDEVMLCGGGLAAAVVVTAREGE